MGAMSFALGRNNDLLPEELHINKDFQADQYHYARNTVHFFKKSQSETVIKGLD